MGSAIDIDAANAMLIAIWMGCSWPCMPGSAAADRPMGSTRFAAAVFETNVPTGRCPYHHGVEIDVASGMAVGPSCRDGETRVESFVLWPSAVRRWLDDRHRWQPSPPAWAPGCDPIAAGSPPRILSPGSDEVFVLIPGVAADAQEKILSLDQVEEANVELVWDPPWHQSMISAEGRKKLGLD